MPNGESIYVAIDGDESLRQGEIITNLIQSPLRVDTIDSDAPVIDPKPHPYAIVVSQDCDLDWDHKVRQGRTGPYKIIPNVLFCEVSTAEQLRGRGSDAGINSKTWNNIRNNKHERYHFLQLVTRGEDMLDQGLPELGIDFTRYFTIPTEEVYTRVQINEAQRRCRLISPYLEHFSVRFAYFQFRVALPADHYSEPVQAQIQN